MGALLALLALMPGTPPAAWAASERLFVYVSDSGEPWDPEGDAWRNESRTMATTDPPFRGRLVGLWLPSGRRFTLPRASGARTMSSLPRTIRVAPDGRSVAYVARVNDSRRPWLWIGDVALGHCDPLFGFGEDDPDAVLEWLGPERLGVEHPGLTLVERRADGWHRRDGGAISHQSEARLKAIERRLERKEPSEAHEALGISPDGKSVAAYAFQDGGIPEEPGPVPPGTRRRRLVAYDLKTLRRRFAGPSWDEAQGMEPVLRRFVGWVGDAVADVGPGRGGGAKLTLRGPAGVREYPLPGLVGGLWSMGGY